MQTEKFTYPLIRLPRKVEITLFLIQEELKSYKLFEGLHAAGLEDSYYQTHLNKLIMHYTGLDEDSDEEFSQYQHLLEKHGKKIEADRSTISKRTLEVYIDLMILKRKKMEGTLKPQHR